MTVLEIFLTGTGESIRMTILETFEKITKSGLSSVIAMCHGKISDFDGMST